VSTSSLKARLVACVGRLVIDVEFDTAPGTLVVVGPNGAGKSSLLSLLLGALSVESGRIEIGATVLHDSAAQIHVPLEQRRLGYVPQDYALFPHLNVRQNIDFAIASARPQLDRKARAHCIDTLLDELNLQTQGEQRTHTLSGGEKQRVALARALSVEPRALLLDEPLAALDVHARQEVRGFLAAYLKKLALPTLVITHDVLDARQLGHRILVLEEGKITQVGTWTELAMCPASSFVEEFVRSGNNDL
jgi:molybdate transport system ATP-binding protein